VSSIRHALVTTALACAALTLTACQPDDADTGTAAPTVTASDAASTGGASTGGASTGGASASPSAKGDSKEGGCVTLAPGHKYVLVESVSGAMNTLTTKDAVQHCNPDEGAFYQANGKEHEYTVASGDTPITVLHLAKKGSGKMTAANGGIAHIRVCVNGTAQDTATEKADTSDCYGQNFFDVAVNGAGKITEMTELYGS